MDSQTYILFALAVDVILGVVLVFLWLRQRDELHAIFWAVGQLSLTAGTAIWFLGPAQWPKLMSSAILLTTSVAGFWSGTEYFLGNLKRRHLQSVLVFFLGFCLAVYLAWSSHPQWIQNGAAWILGLVILWAGLRLSRNRNHFRFLGFVLMVRGASNLANAAGVVPTNYELWFIYSALIKTVSMLSLIYAVQEKIQQRYAHTIDSLSSGFLIQDRDGYIHVINERGARLLGYACPAEIVGTHIADHISGATRQMVADYFRRFEAADKHYPFVETATISLQNGQRLPVELIASPYFERGQLHCMVQLMDISERKKKDEQLFRASRYDTVTGFLNRHGLSLELTDLIAHARGVGGECAILFIDVDKFKRINDSFGHVAGDQLLNQMAQRLHGLLRADDVLARFGGDEFVIVLPGLPSGAARTMAAFCGERLLASLANSFSLAHQTITVSASIGVACYPEHGHDADTLIRNADIAMYDVKKTGRGELRFFDDAMNAHAKQVLVIDGALRGAIEAGELRLVYQPIIDARSGKMTKVEALLRWHSALLGPVAPDRFIPVAEDSGLIVELGTWVLNETCRQLARWREVSGIATVSINVSARQLLAPEFIGLVEHALAVNGLSASQLELELTERVLIDDGANVRATLARLNQLGVSISLDDFGTGYSSLSYLTQFQINTLKIDRSFVMDIEHSARSKSLVATIIAMGHSLGLELVAEGVETAFQAVTLEEMGCHYLQGYHISKPVAPDELLLFAARQQSAPLEWELSGN